MHIINLPSSAIVITKHLSRVENRGPSVPWSAGPLVLGKGFNTNWNLPIHPYTGVYYKGHCGVNRGKIIVDCAKGRGVYGGLLLLAVAE